MISPHDIDGAINKRFLQSNSVCTGSQRWINFVYGVIASNQLLCEEQVMRGYLGRDANTLLLGPANHFDSAQGCQVANMQPRPRLLR